MTLLPQRDSSPGRTPTVLDFSLLALSFQSGWAFTKVLSEERHLGDSAQPSCSLVWCGAEALGLQVVCKSLQSLKLDRLSFFRAFSSLPMTDGKGRKGHTDHRC